MLAMRFVVRSGTRVLGVLTRAVDSVDLGFGALNLVVWMLGA